MTSSKLVATCKVRLKSVGYKTKQQNVGIVWGPVGREDGGGRQEKRVGRDENK